MLPPLIDIALFRNAIENNHLILTANQRLANQIHQAWGQSLKATVSVWSKPRIMSIEHWLSFCWHELQDQNHSLVHELVELDDMQSLYYWERAINEYENQPQPNSPFANLANNSLNLLQRWNLTIDDVDYTSNSVDKFRGWCNIYQRMLDKRKLVTTPTTWTIVNQGFEQGALAKEQTIALYGFQTLPPLQTMVLESASDKVTHIHSTAQPIDCVKVQCADSDNELHSAAKWAASELAKNSQQRIGILVPELTNSVHLTARVINEALSQFNCPTTVNISAGTALNETPLVYSALGLLKLLNYNQTLEEWIGLLHSPYWVFQQLPIQFKVDCEIALRSTCNYQLSFDKFVQLIRVTHGKLEETTDIDQQLAHLYTIHQQLKHKRSARKTFSEWAQFFQELLQGLQWPGHRELNSLEYQQRQQWHKLLENYCELDNLGIKVTRSTAHSYLKRLANKHIFHPQTGDAPLQILGLLEGTGLKFDQLWIMGLHSDNFPSTQSMDPLLPAQFQRAQAMPHSVPERELQIANELLASYQSNTEKLIFSWPLKDADTVLEPSPLIREIPQLELNQLLPLGNTLPTWLLQDYQCDLVPDKAPPFDRDFESIRGGSGILKNQSTCPFNAFVTYRLGANPPKEPLLGLSPMARGNIVHEVLFRLWGNWKSSKKLNNLSTSEVTEQVDSVIETVLTEQAKHYPVLLGLRFKQLEAERLKKMIMPWLELEQERPPFEVVAVEQTATISFGELNLTLAIDRVDNIEGKTVLIDYKTGNISAKDWLGERPKDPQLPLYVLSSQQPPSGCTFAHLTGNNPKFSGLMDSSLIPPISVSEDWPKQLQQWQQALQNLADEFIQGYCKLDVYNRKEFDYQSYLLPLNRWYEQEQIKSLLAYPPNASQARDKT